MKKNWIYAILLLSTMVVAVACSDDEEEKYSSTVIRDVELFMNGKPYTLGMSGFEQHTNRILFMYSPSGDYLGSYMPAWNFSLENGSYKVCGISSFQTLIGDSGANLNTLSVAQDSAADKTFMDKIVISDPVEYTVPSDEPLKVNLQKRVGTIRLLALDVESDYSYSTVRAIVTTPRSAYRLADASYVDEPMETVRQKNNDLGGRNYQDDFVFFPTESPEKGVSVRFEFLDADKNVVKTKEIEGTYGVYTDSIHTLQVYLNDPDNNTALPFVPEVEKPDEPKQ